MNRTGFSPDTLRRLSELEDRLQYRFHDISLLATALTHSSWANEHNTVHNERLEFLGDAVLELNVSHEIYKRFPQEREGGMTRLRSRLVSEGKLAELARSLKLGDMLFMGRGEEAQGGRERAALIADAMEAVLGAVYLDGGHKEASALIHRLYADRWPAPGTDRRSKDYKTRLQEIVQQNPEERLSYVVESESGPDHDKHFVVAVRFNSDRVARGEGRSKKAAEQHAAKEALKLLGVIKEK